MSPRSLSKDTLLGFFFTIPVVENIGLEIRSRGGGRGEVLILSPGVIRHTRYAAFTAYTSRSYIGRLLCYGESDPFSRLQVWKKVF